MRNVHAPRLFQVGVAPIERPLDGDRGAHGLHRAAEFRKKAVAGGRDDAALMLLDELGHHAAIEVQRLERAFLVRAHEPAVTGHIGGEDSGKAALNALFRHLRLFSGCRGRLYGRGLEESIEPTSASAQGKKTPAGLRPL